MDGRPNRIELNGRIFRFYSTQHRRNQMIYVNCEVVIQCFFNLVNVSHNLPAHQTLYTISAWIHDCQINGTGEN